MEKIIKDIISTQTKVHTLLLDNIEFRDDNTKLVCALWSKQLEDLGVDINKITGKDFARFITSKISISYETITRCSRKLQMKYPELRGDFWEKRKGIEQVVKKEINKI